MCRMMPQFRFAIVGAIPPASPAGRAVVLRTEPDGLGPAGFHPYRENRPPAQDELR